MQISDLYELSYTAASIEPPLEIEENSYMPSKIGQSLTPKLNIYVASMEGVTLLRYSIYSAE